MADLTITIELVNQAASQGFREFSRAARSATDEATRGYKDFEKAAIGVYDKVQGEAKRYFQEMRKLDRELYDSRILLSKAQIEFQEREALDLHRSFTKSIADRKRGLKELRDDIVSRGKEETETIKRMIDEQDTYISQRRSQRRKAAFEEFKDRADLEGSTTEKIRRMLDEQEAYVSQKRSQRKRAAFEEFKDRADLEGNITEKIKRITDEQEAYASQKRSQRRKVAFEEFKDRADLEGSTSAKIRRMLDEQEAYASQKRLERKRGFMDDFLARSRGMELERREGAKLAALQAGWDRDRIRSTDNVTLSTDKSASAIMGVARAYTFMRLASETMQIITEAWRNQAEQIKNTKNELEKYYNTTSTRRKQLAELAAYRGEEVTTESVANYSQRAGLAGLTFEQLVGFETEVFGKAAGAIGPGGKRLSGPQLQAMNKRISDPEAAAFMEWAAQYSANVLHLPDINQAAPLAATLLQQAPVGSKSDDIKERFAKIMGGVQSLRGKTGQSAMATSQIMIELQRRPFDVEETKGLLGMQAAAALRGEKDTPTYMRAMDRLFREMTAPGKAEQEEREEGESRMRRLGIRKDMTLPEFSEQLFKKQQEYIRRNPRETAQDFAQKVVKGGDQIRQFYGLVAQLTGKELGVGESVMADFDQMNLAVAQQRVQRGNRGEIAREQAGQGFVAAEQARQATRSEPWQQLLRDVEPAAISNIRAREHWSKEAMDQQLRSRDRFTTEAVKQEQNLLAMQRAEQGGREAYESVMRRSREGAINVPVSRRQAFIDERYQKIMEAGGPEAEAAEFYRSQPYYQPLGRLLPGPQFMNERRFGGDTDVRSAQEMIRLLHILVQQGEQASRVKFQVPVQDKPDAIPMIGGALGNFRP